MIWDNGTFDIESMKVNRIIVNTYGRKLKGRYCLLHFKPDKSWLFFKVKEEVS